MYIHTHISVHILPGLKGGVIKREEERNVEGTRGRKKEG
jgi:hypothetical protein